MSKKTPLPPPCDPDIFANGEGICIFHASTKVTEPWVQKVAKLSGQRVDWHYSGGMVNMLYIGDYAKVKAAIEELYPELVEAHVEDVRVRGLESKAPERFRILPPGEYGLYRKGDLLPEGVIAVDTTS